MSKIAWFPGHIAKTQRLLQEHIKWVDVIVEVVDGRIPGTTRYPGLEKLVHHKPQILFLNKIDLSDAVKLQAWTKKFREEGMDVVPGNAKKGEGIKTLVSKIQELTREKQERKEAKGLLHRSARVMIVGMPNTGKSSLINGLVGKHHTKTANKPGVTRQPQWVRVKAGFELLDMPGILPPALEDQEKALLLAGLGVLGEKGFDITGVASATAKLLAGIYPQLLRNRYGLGDEALTSPHILEAIGRKRGFLVRGGEVDLERTGLVFLSELRQGVLGPVTLEVP